MRDKDRQKKILFLTTTSLSTNPRLVKLLLYLSKENECRVIAFSQATWSDDLDKELIEQYNFNVQYISARRNPFLPWLFFTATHQLFKLLNKVNKSILVSAYSSNKRSIQLGAYLRQQNRGTDLVIAYNLGAFYPVMMFARRCKVNLLLDVEDYYPGETIDSDFIEEKRRRELLMKKIIPVADGVTFASPLIKEATERLLEEQTMKKALVINNSFSLSEFVEPIQEEGEKIKFIWFSQHISHGRGLELFLEAADSFSEEIMLTLIGKLDKEFYDDSLKERDYIKIIPPMSQKLLHRELSHYDVGLALEMSKADFNRQICLTNKIFACIQAGNYVLATNTPAQKSFMKSYQWAGRVVEQNVVSIKEAIKGIIENREEIRAGNKSRYHQAENLSYETEVIKIKNLISNFSKSL